MNHLDKAMAKMLDELHIHIEPMECDLCTLGDGPGCGVGGMQCPQLRDAVRTNLQVMDDLQGGPKAEYIEIEVDTSPLERFNEEAEGLLG